MYRKPRAPRDWSGEIITYWALIDTDEMKGHCSFDTLIYYANKVCAAKQVEFAGENLL
jgi:hypothetical protein